MRARPKRRLDFTPDHSVEITVAPNGGACFGVVRAIKLGFQAAAATGKVHSIGPLIHNESVVRELERRGVSTVAGADEVTEGTAILRSHGIRRQAEATLRERGVKVIDATCPLVKKPQRIAQALGEKGYFLVLVGDPNHPEVQGVLSYFGRPDYAVLYDPAALDAVPTGTRRVGILAQTTIEASVLEAVTAAARERFEEVAVYNTICDATSVRQTEAATLSRTADVVVVVGGHHSSNTNKLVKICRGNQPDTHHVESIEEIEPAWFAGKRKIAVTGGASTPQDYVDLAAEHIATLLGRP